MVPAPFQILGKSKALAKFLKVFVLVFPPELRADDTLGICQKTELFLLNPTYTKNLRKNGKEGTALLLP